MAEPFDTLMAVQEHDTTLDQLRHRTESLPERAVLRDVADAARPPARPSCPRCGRAGRRSGRPPADSWRSRSRPPPRAVTRSSSGCGPARLLVPRSAGHGPRGPPAGRPPGAVRGGGAGPARGGGAAGRRCWPSSGRPPTAWRPRLPGSRRPSPTPRPTSATTSRPSRRTARRCAAGPPRRPGRAVRASAEPGWAGWGRPRLVGDRCDGCHLTLPAVEVERIRACPPTSSPPATSATASWSTDRRPDRYRLGDGRSALPC